MNFCSPSVKLDLRLLGSLALLAMSIGCAQTMQRHNVASSVTGAPPQPNQVGQTSVAPTGAGSAAANATTANRSANTQPSGEGKDVVRGQDTGYALPPTIQTNTTPSPGGGGYTRGALPVSGQNVQAPLGSVPPGPSVRTAQNVSPYGAAQAPTTGGPYSGGGSYSPNGVVRPAAPMNTTYGNGQSTYGQPTYGNTQPSGFGTQSQSLPSPSQTIGVPQPPNNSPLVGAPIEPISPGFLDPLSNDEPEILTPRVRTVPVDIHVTPARTGRFMVGGAVNSDAGVTGQIVLDERNFDIMRFPRSFQDLISGYAFRGGGQTFRLEAVPGNQFQRYMVSFGQPYLFNYLPISLSVQGFLFDRSYYDWNESRLGGRLQLGYRVTNDLSLSSSIRAENVDFKNVRVPGSDYVDQYLGKHDLYSGSFRLTHDTRDIPFAPTEGHLLELTYEKVFGSYDYSRWQADFRKYFLLRERADHSGRHTLAFTHRLGISGKETPIFENYFAGGYSTLRGFRFRGASPIVDQMQVGGRLSFLGSMEYQFPLTADDATKGVLFVDYGTIEREIEINRENFRVAPGFGFRVSMPALGPAPLAFDFAFPVASADTDRRQVFSFFMGMSR